MSFQDLGPYELMLLAKWVALPVLALTGLLAWVWRTQRRQRELARRLAALEASQRPR